MFLQYAHSEEENSNLSENDAQLLHFLRLNFDAFPQPIISLPSDWKQRHKQKARACVFWIQYDLVYDTRRYTPLVYTRASWGYKMSQGKVQECIRTTRRTCALWIRCSASTGALNWTVVLKKNRQFVLEAGFCLTLNILWERIFFMRWLYNFPCLCHVLHTVLAHNMFIWVDF